MKQKDLREALSGIDGDYIAESGNFEAIAADFRKEKRKITGMAVSVFCLAFFCIGAVGISRSGLLKTALQTAEGGNSSPIDSSEIQAEISGQAADAEQAPSGALSSGEKTFYYSELIQNKEVPELNGYEDGSGSYSVVSFDEAMLQDAAAVIEGEILDMRVNVYEYATASDKFEPNGRLYHKTSTVAYTVRVDRVWSGSFSVGDTVTVEDCIFVLDSVISVKKGGHYILPIRESEGELFETDEIVSGNTVLESRYSTLYQFHPQIEKVSGGYAVPGDWKTLITDECSEIIMDTEEAELRFPGSLYFVPDRVFEERMPLVLQNRIG